MRWNNEVHQLLSSPDHLKCLVVPRKIEYPKLDFSHNHQSHHCHVQFSSVFETRMKQTMKQYHQMSYVHSVCQLFPFETLGPEDKYVQLHLGRLIFSALKSTNIQIEQQSSFTQPYLLLIFARTTHTYCRFFSEMTYMK